MQKQHKIYYRNNYFYNKKYGNNNKKYKNRNKDYKNNLLKDNKLREKNKLIN